MARPDRSIAPPEPGATPTNGTHPSDPADPTGGHPPGEVDVAVVGAGLAGLTAAAVAARAGARVAVLDSRRPGGRAATTVVDPGVVFNAGPRALYRAGAAWRVLTSLGIAPRGEVPPTEGHAVRDGEVHEMPGTPLKLLRSRLLSRTSKVRLARVLGGLQRLDPARFDDVSLDRWLRDQRLDHDARELVRTTVRIVTYVDDLELSAGTAIRQLQLGLGRGKGVLYLDDGWQQLVDALLAELGRLGVPVLSGRSVRAVEPARPAGSSEPGWLVRTARTAGVAGAEDRGAQDGAAVPAELRAGSVVVATGTPAAAAAVLPVPLDLSGLGPAATAACLELAVRRPPRFRFLQGIGDPLYLSAHSPIARLGPDGLQVVHVMRYGARSTAEDRPALWEHAARAGIREDDVVAHRFLHSMTVMGGIPIGEAGGQAGRPPVEVPGPAGLYVAGDWVGAEGLLADASFASGERAGQLAAERARAARPAAMAAR